MRQVKALIRYRTNTEDIMQKKEFLAHFEGIKENQPIKVSRVPYKHEGSTYAEDGIRITGSTEFIDSVLSRLKDLLKYENGETRLQVVYKESVDRETQTPMGSYNCYIQVHERGGEAKMMNAFIEGNTKKLHRLHDDMLHAAGF
jgi:hypothetical protein